MGEDHPQIGEEPVCTFWPRVIQGALVGFFFVTLGFIAHYYYAAQPIDDLQTQVQELSHQVKQLKQEQAMPAMVLNRYRNSICYIFGIYQVGFPGREPSFRARISGSGFVVQGALVATNRHVAEPWYGDAEATTLINKGAKPKLEKLIAFFPGLSTPVNIAPLELSVQGDLAIVQIEGSKAAQIEALPLADQTPPPGELVAVIGYPMGILGMVAKSPQAVYERLAFRHDDQGSANELAALSLIRPSATYGHLGDVVGDKLIYDAPTAHGGSGGPVFNSQGQVIGINEAYIDGFSGGTLGISVQTLRPLIEAAENKIADRARTSLTASSH